MNWWRRSTAGLVLDTGRRSVTTAGMHSAAGSPEMLSRGRMPAVTAETPYPPGAQTLTSQGVPGKKAESLRQGWQAPLLPHSTHTQPL